jgi:hypothetical protein
MDLFNTAISMDNYCTFRQPGFPASPSPPQYGSNAVRMVGCVVEERATLRVFAQFSMHDRLSPLPLPHY